MIARPVIRRHPIPFTAASSGTHAPRPVSWAASSGPAQHTSITACEPVAAYQISTPSPRIQPARQARALPQPVTPCAGSPVQTPGASKSHSELRAKYVGHGALSVRSSVTGRHYRFQGHGDSQKIDKHDMLMLKRIPDLVVS